MYNYELNGFKPRFYKMQHMDSLEESMKTCVEIGIIEFNYLLHKYQYKYYCYDNRINAHRFIISDMEKYIDMPTWLLIRNEV